MKTIILTHLKQNFVRFRHKLDTLETKLRSFQIRLNMRSIITNIQLHGFEIIESNLCLFCSKLPENLLHSFCDCVIVEKF